MDLCEEYAGSVVLDFFATAPGDEPGCVIGGYLAWTRGGDISCQAGCCVGSTKNVEKTRANSEKSGSLMARHSARHGKRIKVSNGICSSTRFSHHR